MAELKETAVDYIATEKHATFCSSEQKWINKITKLKSSHPDQVQIIHAAEDNHGMIYAHIPKSWLKISPPRKTNLTEEQRAAAAERMAAARERKQND